MDHARREQLIACLEPFVSAHKQQRIRAVLAARTRYVTLVLEDLYKPQNASATLRTCDGLGIQNVHIIENDSPFSDDDEVSLGSSKWLTLHRHRNESRYATPQCYKHLRARGYRIVATSPAADGCLLDELPLDQPLACVYGNEEQGLSRWAIEHADCTVRLPMYGFTQSYNITVSVALALGYLMEKLRRTDIDWHLEPDEQRDLMLAWYRGVVRASDLIEKQCAAD